MSLYFLNEGGGEFWVKKTSPLPPFNHFRAEGARPGELTLFFFWQEFFTKLCLTFGLVLVYFKSQD